MMNRREFLRLLGAGALTTPLVSAGETLATAMQSATLTFAPMLDLHKAVTVPLIIQKAEILRREKDLFIRVTAKNGAVGIIEANNRMPQVISLFKELVAPFFIGKDARDVETLVDGVYTEGSNYKFAGMPFWNSVGNLEIALFDMMSRAANKPVYELLGKRIRNDVSVYLTRLTRDTTPEKELEIIERDFAETGCRAVKIKVGGRMKAESAKIENRSEALIKLARKKLGDSVTIYADANSSYDVPTAIEMGKLLQDNGVKIWEEPCPWQDYDSTKAVADALDMAIAGGEQDTSLWQFKAMIKHKIVDVVQPDLFYNGGFVRTLRVAKMAAEAGMTMDCHSPKFGVGAYPFRHLVSVVPNIGAFQEYNLNSSSKPLGEIKNGKVELPTGVGLGIEYRPSEFEKVEIL